MYIYFVFGLKGFYKGLGSKIIYTILNNALMFMIYDRLKENIQKNLKNIHKKD